MLSPPPPSPPPPAALSRSSPPPLPRSSALTLALCPFVAVAATTPAVGRVPVVASVAVALGLSPAAFAPPSPSFLLCPPCAQKQNRRKRKRLDYTYSSTHDHHRHHHHHRGYWYQAQAGSGSRSAAAAERARVVAIVGDFMRLVFSGAIDSLLQTCAMIRQCLTWFPRASRLPIKKRKKANRSD